MLRTLAFRLVMVLAVLAGLVACTPPAGSDNRQPSHAGLPPEAIETLALIQRGGPFPYRKDGTTFHNRERLLPAKPRGYYREYTVRTPGSRDRGARRIVAGGDPPEVFYYTADHYSSFRQIEPLP
ncbi:MAG TPA: ribonuclease [Thauera sp.]|nr:ribonuclease [Thauera sp.]HHW62485.1 ribonuclease [Rhodocyclaceae bacterium]